jgi:hypothetical protein
MVRRREAGHRGGPIRLALVYLLATATFGVAHASGPNVLLVGPPGTVINGAPAQYASLQAAIDAAAPGDWILVAPGDYKAPASAANWGDGVWIGKAVHIRGLSRNDVVIDGTKSGPECSNAVSDQGPAGNGIEVAKGADGASVENLTACNYLGGQTSATSASYTAGNEIFFDGNDPKYGNTSNLTDFVGRYLTATTTFVYPNGTQADGSVPSNDDAQYGIFASHVGGPTVDGTYANLIDHTYANNMADSAYYIGACPNCSTVLSNGWAENSAIGYSGTNSGGNLLVTSTEFDGSRAGIVPNSLNNNDAPSPQNGVCPVDAKHSCTLFKGNIVHDNNNPNAPGSGIAGSAPTGSGIELVAGQNDVVTRNIVYNQDAWGVIVHDFPDTETPPTFNGCSGGIPAIGPNKVVSKAPAWICFFQGMGNRITDNTLYDNGGFGQTGDGDLGNATSSVVPGNCFAGNVDTKGRLTSDPPAIQTVDGRCGGPAPGDLSLSVALICDSGLFGACPSTGPLPVDNYPQQQVGPPTVIDFQTTLARAADASHNQGTMPDPCVGVPATPWCP